MKTSFHSAILFALLLISTVSFAQSIAGQYRCASYSVSFGGGTCRGAPPLVLNPDGTYQMSSEKGTWKARDGVVELSESKTRGPGKLADGNRIVFEYDYKGQHHTLTYLCQSCGGK